MYRFKIPDHPDSTHPPKFSGSIYMFKLKNPDIPNPIKYLEAEA